MSKGNRKPSVPYGRGKAAGYRGLGDSHSKPYRVSQERWDKIFGKKDGKDESSHS